MHLRALTELLCLTGIHRIHSDANQEQQWICLKKEKVVPWLGKGMIVTDMIMTDMVNKLEYTTSWDKINLLRNWIGEMNKNSDSGIQTSGEIHLDYL